MQDATAAKNSPARSAQHDQVAVARIPCRASVWTKNSDPPVKWNQDLVNVGDGALQRKLSFPSTWNLRYRGREGAAVSPPKAESSGDKGKDDRHDSTD